MLILCVAFYCVYTLGSINAQRSKKPSPFVPTSASASGELTIQVAGCVARPGVYRLPPTSRVQDALDKAGGLTVNADTSALNLAGWLQDGAKIEVPVRSASVSTVAPPPPPSPLAPTAAPITTVPNTGMRGTGMPTTGVPEGNAPIANPSGAEGLGANTADTSAPINNAPVAPMPAPLGAPVGPLLPPGATVSKENAPELLRRHPLDINTASAAQLEMLPEIGPKMAQRILDSRTTNGAFTSVEDLRRVKGIGEKTFAAIRPFIYVSSGAV